VNEVKTNKQTKGRMKMCTYIR